MTKGRKLSLLKMYQSPRNKVTFFKGWTSLNEYLTSRLTFNVKVILENRLTNGKSMKHIESIIKLNIDTFFKVYRFEYKAAIGPEELGHENNDRINDIFDVIFKDKANIFHHFVIRGMERDRAILKQDHTIFYDSSDEGAIEFSGTNRCVRPSSVWDDESSENENEY